MLPLANIGENLLILLLPVENCKSEIFPEFSTWQLKGFCFHFITWKGAFSLLKLLFWLYPTETLLRS